MKKKLLCLFFGSMMAFSGFTCPGQTVRVYDDDDWRNNVIDILDDIQGGLDDIDGLFDDEEED